MELPALHRDQVRKVDQIAIEQFGMPGVALMENAGRGAAAVVDRLATEGVVAIVCGGGNNGGDGYVIARHLELFGRAVQIVSLGQLESLSGDARINAVIAERAGIEIRIVSSRDEIEAAMTGATNIVDCLLGTGAQGPLRGLFADAVSVANSQPAALRFAIDIPTGLDCDSGVAAEPTFRADHTITFVSRKIGFERGNAEEFVGVVHEVGIGVPKKLLVDMLLS